MGFCGVQKPAALMWPICRTRTILTTYTCGFSDLFVAHAVTAAFAGPPYCLEKSEVDGSPPFCLPDRHGGVAQLTFAQRPPGEAFPFQ